MVTELAVCTSHADRRGRLRALLVSDQGRAYSCKQNNLRSPEGAIQGRQAAVHR